LSGHSKWSTIKRKKGAVDAARGKVFTKLIKEIHVAAKMGDSGDVAANPRLRLAVDKAKGQSMPRQTIERAIAKAMGSGQDENWENITYEGYGQGGVAVLVETLTDNRNRTASDVRHAFSKGGGNLGTSGSVAYMFAHKAQFTFPAEGLDEDTVMMAVLEGGGDEYEEDDGNWVVTAEREAYDTCKTALEALGVEINGELTRVPENLVEVSPSDAKKVMALLERLDDLDDVQDTYTNADFDEDALDD